MSVTALTRWRIARAVEQQRARRLEKEREARESVRTQATKHDDKNSAR